MKKPEKNSRECINELFTMKQRFRQMIQLELMAVQSTSGQKPVTSSDLYQLMH